MRTQYIIRVHPNEYKAAYELLKEHPKIIFIMKDKTLHEIYGCDDKEAMEAFQYALRKDKNLRRG